jgi:hypothetical protein
VTDEMISNLGGMAPHTDNIPVDSRDPFEQKDVRRQVAALAGQGLGYGWQAGKGTCGRGSF